ncbi:hypothetical protein [Roseovarius indicus]|uniref:Uncharacterized protein n=1 Tax=Roseovarius indicus TaxID=540747 RepID=A0A0T5P151_9RHOB|nr:hypothetical protein [Roseovarius indicus]KRS14874.1 hypothetical protein XM52_26630 [Roseovarius indicus]QEW29963.1 hypothetical protein RIdsm_05809 [Roseovarius indicus]SFE72027.1 hypothetical protein SAMN04488031_11781 [Roseovarius indicus]
MRKHFAINMPALRFARNTLVFSLLGLIPVLLAYVILTPGFGTLLLGGGPPLSRFLRQVVTNGLPVVFLLNYVSFFLFAWIVATPDRSYKLSFIVLADLPVRVLSFVGLHALIYVLSADWFGSFGGSRASALRVVAPTLVRSFLFENISGVYLYATLVSALPLYVTAVENSEGLGQLAKAFPGRSGSVLFAFVIFAFYVIAMTAFAALLVWWGKA